MKFFYLTSFLVLAVYITATHADYRYKRRGPTGPMPHRPPMMPPQYHKKWHGPPQIPQSLQMHRGPPRPRPIPHHHMNLNKNFPKQPYPNVSLMKRPVPPAPVPPPVSAPVPVPVPLPSNLRNVWKSPQPNFNSINVHQEKPFIHQEKPFVSSPAVPKNEYDFHIQTNNIPNHLNTIKQVDEKGPIHTIPAPKLSPADKPKIIEEVRPTSPPEHHEPVHTIVQVQKAHQYQVTESPDINQKPYYFQPEITLGSIQDFDKTLGSTDISQGFKINPVLYQGGGILPSGKEQLPSPDLFKFINTYPQQQQLLDTYPLPLMQQPQLQQHLTQSNTQLLANPQLFQQQVSYMTQIQHDIPNNEKVQINPEFHTFNYEEPQKSQARIDLAPEDEYLDHQNQPNGNPMEALAQAQYVQHYFDTRDDAMKVEPDAKPSPQTFLEEEEEQPEETVFYASLPSKEAADALASLQEAGKLNSKQQNQQVSHTMPMTIYVPDENETEEEQDDGSRSGENYDEIPSKEEKEDSQRRNKNFGNKLKPKNN